MNVIKNNKIFVNVNNYYNEKMCVSENENVENENVENENIENVEKVGGCIEILKSGLKKGSLCGCKVKQNGLCGRHSK